MELPAVDTGQAAADNPPCNKRRVEVQELPSSFEKVHGNKMQLLASLQQFADLARTANAQLAMPLLQDQSAHAMRIKYH